MRGDDSRSQANEVRSEGGEDEREWRFAVEDVGPGGVVEDTSTPSTEPIEPGAINVEHAAFVVVGILTTVGTLVFGF